MDKVLSIIYIIYPNIHVSLIFIEKEKYHDLWYFSVTFHKISICSSIFIGSRCFC